MLPLYTLMAVLGLSAAPTDPTKGRFEYDPADETVTAVMIGNENCYDPHVATVWPSAATGLSTSATESANGVTGGSSASAESVWLTWLEFEPGKGDRIWVGSRELNAQDFASRTCITPEPGIFKNPTLTADKTGGLWLTYEKQDGEKWSVAALRLDDKGQLASGTTSPSPLTVGPGINHRIAAAPDAGAWIVWQAPKDGHFEIMAAQLTDKGVAHHSRIRNPGLNERVNGWQPDVAVMPDGEVHVVWDGNECGFDVYHAVRKEDVWDGRLLAGEEGFEGRTRIVTDAGGHVWSCWEEGNKNWGTRYISRMRRFSQEQLDITDDNGPLHGFRRLHFAMLKGPSNPFGMSAPMEFEFPMPAFEKLATEKRAQEDVTKAGGFYERGELAVDGLGRVWLVYRHYYVPWLGIEKITHVQQDWGVFAKCFDGEGWSKVFRCNVGQGDGMQRLSVTGTADGVAVAFTTGRTDRRKDGQATGIALCSFNLLNGEESVIVPRTDLMPLISRWIDSFYRKDEWGAKRPPYQLFFGDLHRHTDLSLCDVASDGTMDDAYRYAIDVAHLDFMGITDHSRDIAEGNAKSLLWWRCRKEVSRHDLSPNFIPMYAYEHSRAGEDHNVISLKPQLWPDKMPFPDLWKQMDNDTFTIPHQTICKDVPPGGEMPLGLAPKTWEYRDDAHRPLFEIYQACRDRAVEPDANMGLNKGHIFGFIASSDHHSTNASFAGVWAKEKTREAIFRAMQARRTFGATDRIRLKVTMGEHWMGEKVKASQLAPIRVEADGTASIVGIDLIVDGETKQDVAKVEGNVIDTQVTLPALTGNGIHYFYVRLRQSDGNQAWSSPIWVE